MRPRRGQRRKCVILCPKTLLWTGKLLIPSIFFYRLAVESLNVINGPKCNKVLNVITFGAKCNKLLRVISLDLKSIEVMLSSSMK